MRFQSLGSAAASALLALGVVVVAPALAAPMQFYRLSDVSVDGLGVMTYNLWHGGNRINNYHDKQVRFIQDSGADIVGLQESNGDHAGRLGDALGWYHWQSSDSVGVISRFPIVEEYGEINRAGGVRVDVQGTEINVWVTHLQYTPYGPYDFCFGDMSSDQVMGRETESGRVGQITETLEGIQSQVDDADNIPVILMGDFNAPSHLDWIPELQEDNCGVSSFQWPTSVLTTDAGFTDSFREINPDPISSPGISWSPIYPYHEGTTGDPEPQDRIDFTYHAGALTVWSSETRVAGEPSPWPNHADNEWTSDHRAVLTHYTLTG